MKFTYEVLADEFIRAGEASSEFKLALQKIGIPSDIIRQIAVAMYEAEINMVIHANGGEIEAEVTKEKVEVKISDTGPGIPDINKAMEEGFSTATEEVRDLGFGAGMGLPNMKKNTDVLEIESEEGVGTTVYIEVNL